MHDAPIGEQLFKHYRRLGKRLSKLQNHDRRRTVAEKLLDANMRPEIWHQPELLDVLNFELRDGSWRGSATLEEVVFRRISGLAELLAADDWMHSYGDLVAIFGDPFHNVLFQEEKLGLDDRVSVPLAGSEAIEIPAFA